MSAKDCHQDIQLFGLVSQISTRWVDLGHSRGRLDVSYLSTFPFLIHDHVIRSSSYVSQIFAWLCVRIPQSTNNHTPVRGIVKQQPSGHHCEVCFQQDGIPTQSQAFRHCLFVWLKWKSVARGAT